MNGRSEQDRRDATGDSRFEIRMPAELLAELHELAARNERTASAEARVGIRRHVERERDRRSEDA
jgi:predicted transcriptional regulator